MQRKGWVGWAIFVCWIEFVCWIQAEHFLYPCKRYLNLSENRDFQSYRPQHKTAENFLYPCKAISSCENRHFQSHRPQHKTAEKFLLPCKSYFLLWKSWFSVASPPWNFIKLSMCDQFSFDKMTIFINIAPIEKYLLCVDKIGSCNA